MVNWQFLARLHLNSIENDLKGKFSGIRDGGEHSIVAVEQLAQSVAQFQRKKKLRQLTFNFQYLYF
jgi:hypothetical protein